MKLLQAVLTAHTTIVFALTKIDPDEFTTVTDWQAVRQELHGALKAPGTQRGINRKVSPRLPRA